MKIGMERGKGLQDRRKSRMSVPARALGVGQSKVRGERKKEQTEIFCWGSGERG